MAFNVRSRRWVFVLLAVGTLVAVACGSAAQNDSDRTADGSAPSTRDAEGLRIVAYQGEDVLGGSEISFADLLGKGTPVVVNFWAGLCPPCREEMPDLQRVYDQRKDEFLLVGVDVGPFVGLGSDDDARRLLQELNVTYPAAYAEDADILREYNVLGMPTTVFFTPDGEVFSKKTGFMSGSEIEDRLQALLEASGGGSAGASE